MDANTAEVAVLGACLVEGSGIMAIADFLKPQDFYNEANREIYTSMMELFQSGDPISELTIRANLADRRKLTIAGGASYLYQLAAELPDVANVEWYAREVKNCATTRSLAKLGEDLKNLSGDPRDAVAQALGELINISADSLRSVPAPIGDSVARVYHRAIQLYKEEIQNESIKTGMARFDQVFGGLKASDLIVIAARPSVGKSAFALHLCKLVADQGHKVLLISLEMSLEQIATRMLASESGVPYSRIQDGYLKDSQPEILAESSRRFVNLPLVIDDRSGQTITDIQTKARREQARGGIGLVVVDYLQIAASDSTSYEQVTQVSNGLKALAKDLNIPVIALSQLSRGIEQRDNKRPVLSDLKQSGAIEQDADVVAFLHVPNRIKKNELELEVAKHRNGPLGSVLFRFEKNTQRFEEISGGLAEGLS